MRRVAGKFFVPVASVCFPALFPTGAAAALAEQLAL